MKFLECDLEDIIHNANSDTLSKRGLYLPDGGIKKRQVRIGNYGVSDLIIAHKLRFMITNVPYLYISVFELKRDLVNINTFLQALRYCKGIDSYLKKRGVTYYAFNVVLIGKKICTKSDFCYLPEFMGGDELGTVQSLNVYTYDYAVDGIKFNLENGYGLIKEGF